MIPFNDIEKIDIEQSVESDCNINFGDVLETDVLTRQNFKRLGRSEAVLIPSQCPNCNALGESMTAMTDIPHFKEVSTSQSPLLYF